MTKKYQPKTETEDKALIKERNDFNVKVIHPSLRVRRQPFIGSEIIYMINDMGIYHINESLEGWGRLDDNNWIMLKYTEKVEYT